MFVTPPRWSKATAYRVLQSARVIDSLQLETESKDPITESVARELVPVLKADPEKVEEVWAEVPRGSASRAAEESRRTGRAEASRFYRYARGTGRGDAASDPRGAGPYQAPVLGCSADRVDPREGSDPWVTESKDPITERVAREMVPVLKEAPEQVEESTRRSGASVRPSR